MNYKKIAFFVEGYTEQEFLKKLLIEIFGAHQLAIEVKSGKGGRSVASYHTIMETPEIHDGINYYIMIYNCNGDGSLKTYIKEQRQGLIDAGYSKVIGLMDLYPNFEKSDIHELWYELKKKLPQAPLPISFVISVMEIESWFLADETHYKKINAGLDYTKFKAEFGFDPSVDDTEDIKAPAIMLDAIYKSVSDCYEKKQICIDRTIQALDYANIYFECKTRNNSLNLLIEDFEMEMN